MTAHWNEWQGDSALGPRYSCVWHVVDCICRTSQEWKFKKLGCHVIWECHLKQLIPSDSSINTMLNITVLSKYLTWWKFFKAPLSPYHKFLTALVFACSYVFSYQYTREIKLCVFPRPDAAVSFSDSCTLILIPFTLVPCCNISLLWYAIIFKLIHRNL